MHEFRNPPTEDESGMGKVGGARGGGGGGRGRTGCQPANCEPREGRLSSLGGAVHGNARKVTRLSSNILLLPTGSGR